MIVIRNDIKHYQSSLDKEGLLIISGIYKSDLSKIKKSALNIL